MPIYAKGSLANANRLKLIQSQQYGTLNPADRGALLRTFDESSPEQQEALVSRFTYPAGKPSVSPLKASIWETTKSAGKALGAAVVDATGQALGAYAGGAAGALTGNPYAIVAGKTTGESLGAIGADRLNRAIGLRDPETVETIIPGVTVKNEKVLGPITSGDLIAGATPLAFRGLAGAAKLTTKPGQAAVKQADETNVTNEKKYRNTVEDTSDEIWGRINREQERVDANIADHAEKVQAWKDRNQQIVDEFQARRQKIIDDATLTNAQKTAAHQRAVAEYRDRVVEHQIAYKKLAEAGVTSPGPSPSTPQMFEKVGGHKSLYGQVPELAEQAGSFSTQPIRDVAEKLGVQLRQPAEGTQSRFTRLTDALQEFGAPREATATSPAVASEVPLNRIIATQKKIGEVISSLRRTGGEEYGVAKRLFAEMDEHLSTLAKQDPAAAKAIATQREANYRFMRDQNAQEWQKIWADNAREVQPGVWEVNDQGLRDSFNKLKEDHFWKRAWTPEEQTHMQQTIYQAPNQKIGQQPALDTASPDKPLRDLQFEHDLQLNRQQASQPGPLKPEDSIPQLDRLDYPAYPEPPTPVKPEVNFDNWGPAITTRIAAGELAGRVMGLGSPAPGVGLATAVGIFGVPWAVSKSLLALPGGEQILRNIAAGKQRVTPAMLGGLISLIRSHGGLEDDE